MYLLSLPLSIPGITAPSKETQNHKSLTELYPNLGNEEKCFSYEIVLRRGKGENGVPHWELKLL